MAILICLPWMTHAVTTAQNGIMCTADAKLCPDGSYVGRTGASCEFVCLGSAQTPVPLLGGVLQKGMTSDSIKDVQTILKTDPSIYSGPVTGYFGSQTEQAVKKLQAKYGLAQSGVLDEATQRVILPIDTQVELTIVTPNGGEAWRAGDTQKILWKATFAPTPTPLPPPCYPRPACLDATPRCLPAEPAGGWCAGIETNAPSGSSLGSTVGASVSDVSGKRDVRPDIVPFFPRASLSLTRDSDPTFVRPLGTINLYESQKLWTIPRDIPEAKDYRVRITLGANTPCMYRAEKEAAARGRLLDSNSIYPCPMMSTSNTNITDKMMAYPQYFASDMSDNVFAILGGADTEELARLKRQLAEVEAMLEKLSEQVRILRAAIEKLQQ